MAILNTTIIAKLESSELFFANLMAKIIDAYEIGAVKKKDEDKSDTIYYLITALRYRVDRGLFDNIAIQLYKRLQKEIPYSDDNGQIDPYYLDIDKEYPIQNGLIIIDNTLYPQVLSPSLNLSRLIQTRMNTGLFALNFILDNYTGEDYTFLELSNSDGPYISDGIIIIQLGSRYFKRQWTGDANVLWWGAKPDNATDSTIQVQTAWDSGYPIYMPGYGFNKAYICNSLQIKDGTIVRGASISSETGTFIKPKIGGPIDFITINSGPVTHCDFKKLFIYGTDTVNIGQNGFAVRPVNNSTNISSGLWWSLFEDIFIWNFDGTQIGLYATATGLQPIQTNIFKSCEFHTGTNPNSTAMEQCGQVEQIEWDDCRWAPGTTDPEINTLIKFRTDGSEQFGSGGGSQTFDSQCYIGGAKLGIDAEYAINLKFKSIYFEALKGVIKLTKFCTGILIGEGCNFYSCGVDSGNGFHIKSEDGSCNYILEKAHLFTQPDKITKGLNQGAHEVRDLYAFNKFTSSSEGDYRDIEITIDEDETDLTQGRLNLITSRSGVNGITYDTVKWIDSPWGPGKEFLVTSNFGFNIKSGGNIYALSDIRVFINDSIILKRIDDYYHIIAYIPYKQDGSTVDVIQFGAKGGTNDDTQAFQKAHDYIMLSGGGRVIIPFKAEGYSITNVICTPFCQFIGYNNVVINPITGLNTEVFTMTGVPILQHYGYRIVFNIANPTQTIYNFSYTQNLSTNTNILDTSYITDHKLIPNSVTIDTITTLLPYHGYKIRLRVNGNGLIGDYIRLISGGNIGIPTSFDDGIILRDGDTVEITLRDNDDKRTFTYLITGLVKSTIKMATTPSQGTWRKGEIIDNSAFVAGGNQGWICVQSGNYATTPPVWLPYGSYTTTPGSGVPVVREVPTGVIDGINNVFTLSHTPVIGSELGFLNGLLQQDNGVDYSIAGATVTTVIPPLVGDIFLFNYTY